MSFESPRFGGEDNKEKESENEIFIHKKKEKFEIKAENPSLVKLMEIGFSEEDGKKLLVEINAKFEKEFPSTGMIDGSVSYVEILNASKDDENKISLKVIRKTLAGIVGEHWELTIKKSDEEWKLDKAVEM